MSVWHMHVQHEEREIEVKRQRWSVREEEDAVVVGSLLPLLPAPLWGGSCSMPLLPSISSPI